MRSACATFQTVSVRRCDQKCTGFREDACRLCRLIPFAHPHDETSVQCNRREHLRRECCASILPTPFEHFDSDSASPQASQASLVKVVIGDMLGTASKLDSMPMSEVKAAQREYSTEVPTRGAALRHEQGTTQVVGPLHLNT